MRYWHFYGDKWTSKTTHLSLIREGAYIRLVTWCMVHEKPLPLSRRDCHKIARVCTRHEATAVDQVIAEFFVRQEDGFHQSTVDDVLGWWQDQGKDNTAREVFLSRVRGEAFRKRQRDSVEALRAKGLAVSIRTPMSELVRLCAEHGVQTQTPVQTLGNTNGKRRSNVVANVHYKNKSNTAFAPDGANAVCAPPDDRPGPFSLALRAMQKTGLEGVHPGNPAFVELVTRGALPPLFAAACSEALAKRKGYPWAMAAALGRLNDGVIDLAGNATARPLAGPPRDFSERNGSTVPADQWDALQTRLADPNRDPWELPELAATGPPSPSKGDVPL